MSGTPVEKAGYTDTVFDPNRSFSDLPALPPASKPHCRTRDWRSSASWNIPNTATLINAVPRLETQAGTGEGICNRIHDTGTERCRDPHCARQSALFGGPFSPPLPGGYREGPRAHTIRWKLTDAPGRLELCKGIAPQDRCLDVAAAGCCRDIGSGQTGTTGRSNPGACRRVSGLGWQVSGSGPPFGRVRHNCS